MRLVCPNCSTQYEVDDSAVPATGREVQCGHCSSTWFQAPARSNVPQNGDKGELPKWVEEIVEDDSAEEAADLPGKAPSIASEPNEEIVSEPELEVIIDAGDLDPSPTETAAKAEAELSEKATAESQKSADAAAAAKAVAQSVAAAAIAAKLTGSDKKREVETAQTEPSQAPVEPVQAPVEAPLASEVAGVEATPPELPAVEEGVQEVADETAELAEAKVDFETIDAPSDIANAAPSFVDDAIEATPDSVEDIVPDVDITSATDAVETVETVRDPIVETVGEADIDQVIETAQDVSEDAEIEMPVDADDISTQLETAIKENSTPTEVDLAEIAAAELEATKAAEAAEISAAKEAAEAVKAAEKAAALEMAEKAAARDLEKSAEQVEITEEVVAETAEPSGELEEIEAQIKGALEDLDAGKALPDDPSEERLSDYDVTDGDPVPDEFAVSLGDQESASTAAVTESFDPADITVEPPDAEITVEAPDTEFTVEAPDTEFTVDPPEEAFTIEAPEEAGSVEASEQAPDIEAPEDAPALPITSPSAVDPMVEAIERDAAEDQTESLAAKLKARVAEAAKAQESNTLGTAGVVLGASAAGIAATSTRKSTAFPKRDTEELASSLRPKPVDGNSLKPRLRPAATPEPTKSRFGQGFIMAIALFAVALLIYLFRDQLATAVPALEPALTSYAGFVDNVRGIMNDAIGKLTATFTNQTQT